METSPTSCMCAFPSHPRCSRGAEVTRRSTGSRRPETASPGTMLIVCEAVPNEVKLAEAAFCLTALRLFVIDECGDVDTSSIVKKVAVERLPTGVSFPQTASFFYS